MVVITMTSTISSTIEGVTEQGQRSLHGALQRATTLEGQGGFRALAPSLRQVVWPDKFKSGSIDKYDGSSNSEEFIQVYHTVIEATGGDDRVKVNYLLMTVSCVARSWLINLPEGTIHSWD
jgi:hypothetical protein